MKKEFKDVCARLTDSIIAELERGAMPWMKPWDAAHVAGPVSSLSSFGCEIRLPVSGPLI